MYIALIFPQNQLRNPLIHSHLDPFYFLFPPVAEFLTDAAADPGAAMVAVNHPHTVHPGACLPDPAADGPDRLLCPQSMYINLHNPCHVLFLTICRSQYHINIFILPVPGRIDKSFF